MKTNKSFYSRVGKRLFDISCAVLGLLLLSPILAVCGLVIKLTSPGAVFFRQVRVGMGGQTFRIVKFRTMVGIPNRSTPAIATPNRGRVTPVGVVFRRLKIDELPQLWNVLKGEMSLVGPRPELPEYIAMYTPLQRQVLTVRPGITDIASITYRREEELLGQNCDADRIYRETILQHKLVLNLEYIDRLSFRYDLYLIFRTVGSLLVSVPTAKIGTR